MLELLKTGRHLLLDIMPAKGDVSFLPASLASLPLDVDPPLLFDFGIPLLHRTEVSEFAWAGKSCAVHAQRKELGSELTDANWFYVKLPDGTFHEVQISRLRQALERPPLFANVRSIARALEKESDQSPSRLTDLVALCGL